MRWNCKQKGECYLKSLPDWGILKDCFPRGISPTDIDGLIEIKGNLLVLEWKKPGAVIQEGQQQALRGISLYRKATVFVVFGNPKLPTVEALQEVHLGKFHPAVRCTLKDLRARCQRWGRWANTHPLTGLQIVQNVWAHASIEEKDAILAFVLGEHRKSNSAKREFT